MSLRTRLTSVILYSVISAAFIGPGTVTTAVTTGSKYGLGLAWAVAFSTLACIALQEVAARIAISSGVSFGEALVMKFGSGAGKIYQILLGGVVIAGCAAYQAGNILGAVSGLELLTGVTLWKLTLIVTAISTVVLWTGKREWISKTMIALVGCMGIAFVALAFMQDPIQTRGGSMFPAGSELLVMGLIGTTIVPYNIFIGAGISKGQTIPLMRLGLVISILIGGLITFAIVVAGTSVSNFTSFDVLASALRGQLGDWAFVALSLGLFAAGFSSSITSPFASSLIAANVFGLKKTSHIRMSWGVVMLTGFFFGISGIKPIPVILTVQALNGLILPVLTLFLILIVTDARIIQKQDLHRSWYNLVLLVILFVMLMIGLNNVDKAIVTAFDLSSQHLWLVTVASSLITVASGISIFSRRNLVS